MNSRAASTGIRRAGAKKIDPQSEDQFRTTTRGMHAPAEITQAVESFDAQGQQGEQPTDQQTVGLVMTDMLETMAALGFVKAFILDFPTALGYAEQCLNPTREAGKFVNQ